MRAVAPDRRPPVAAWGFALIALLPLAAAWAGHRYGWAGPTLDLGRIWAMALLGLSAGMIAAAGSLRGIWRPAYLALIAAMVPLPLVWVATIPLGQALSVGFVIILGLDLWAARVGLVPEWWPRLKLGQTALALALLLGPDFG